MESINSFNNWPQPAAFSVSRINLAQQSSKLSGLQNQLGSFAITPINLRDQEFIRLLVNSLDQIIQQIQEIADFLHMSVYVNHENPANLKAEKIVNEVDYYAREAKRSLTRLAIRQISSRNNFQLENQITMATANLNVALSTFCRILREAKYQELFFVEAKT